MKTQDKKPKYFYLGLLLIIGVLAFIVIKQFAISIVVAALLTYITYPLYARLYKKIRSKPLSSFIMVLALFLIIIIPITIFTGLLLNEVTSLIRSPEIQQLEEAGSKIEAFTGQELKLKEVTTVALGKLREAVSKAAPNVISKISTISLHFFVLLFTMFYLFLDGERTFLYISKFFPKLGHGDFILNNIKTTTKAVIVGQLLTAVIQGVLGGIGLWIFGVPKVIFWTFIMIVLSIIPLVGAFLVWLPAAVYLLVQGSMFQGVGLIIYGVLIVSQVDNIVRPKLISSKANVHPIAVLLGVLGGVTVFGLMGILLGPLILSLFVTLLECYRQL